MFSVALLDPAVGKIRNVRAEHPKRDPKQPCLYVGMTGLTPEERFANHKAGLKDASLVKRSGIRLVPELYEHLNSMPFEAAVNGAALAPDRMNHVAVCHERMSATRGSDGVGPTQRA